MHTASNSMINTALVICIFVSTLSTMDDVGMYKRAHIGTEFGAVFVDKTLTDYVLLPPL